MLPTMQSLHSVCPWPSATNFDALGKSCAGMFHVPQRSGAVAVSGDEHGWDRRADRVSVSRGKRRLWPRLAGSPLLSNAVVAEKRILRLGHDLRLIQEAHILVAGDREKQTLAEILVERSSVGQNALHDGGPIAGMRLMDQPRKRQLRSLAGRALNGTTRLRGRRRVAQGLFFREPQRARPNPIARKPRETRHADRDTRRDMLNRPRRR